MHMSNESIFSASSSERLGSILALDEFNVEAFGADRVSLGVFEHEDEAINTIIDRWCMKRRSNGGDPSPLAAPGGRALPRPASDIDTRTVMVTFFPNKSAQSQRCIELSLPQLAEQIRQQSGPSKLELPWLKLMVFGEARSRKGCLRTNANAEAVTGIEVEHDKGEITFDAAIAVMRKCGIRALLYTSPSYVPTVKERWRILLPLSNNLPPDRRAMLVARVNGLFNGKLAPESFVLSQAYLYGCVNSNPDHRVEVIDGDFIDLATCLDPDATGKSSPGTNPRQPRPLPAAMFNGQKVPKAMAHLDPGNSLGDGVEGPPPLLFDAILAECGWLRHVYDTGGADQSEMLWRDSLRACMFLENGESLIHEFSNKHDGYDPEETCAKFDRARQDKKDKDLGYPKCRTICDHGSPHCKACPHLAADKSPLNLGSPPPPTESLPAGGAEIQGSG